MLDEILHEHIFWQPR